MPYVYDLGQRPWVGPVAGLALLLLLHHILRYYQYRRKRSANGCRPPPSYPHADGALGIGHFLTVVKAKKEKRLPDLFCSIFGDPNTHTIAHFMLGKKSYWTREPKNIKALLSSNFKDWGLPNARAKAFSRCWGGGIFGADGHQWEHSRAILRPSFNRTQIQDTDLLARHVANLICRIPDGEEIDLSELFPLFTMDIGIELMFGESTGCLDPAKSEEGKEFASCFNYIMRQMSVQLTIPMSASLPNTKLDQSVNFIYDYVDCFVNRALEVRGEHSDKSKLADEEKAEPSSKYCLLEELAKGDESPKQLRGELLSIMVAGRDTTASLLGILWWHLARRADVVQKLRDEIALLEGRSPSAKELKNMKYLERVLNEVLRLYPINPINSRTARCDTILPTGGGDDGQSPVYIAKGETVIFSSLALHRRTDIWGEDAKHLRPERWDSIRPSTWEYIPFGGGPRLCLGQQLALLEAAYATVRLLQEFRHLEPMTSDPFVEEFAMALTSGDGCKVKLSRHV